MKQLHSFASLLTKGLLLAGIALVVPACSQREEVQPDLSTRSESAAKTEKTFYGPAVPLGQGVGRAWVTVNAAGTPTAMGVDISARSVAAQGTAPTEHTFRLPQQVAVPPFDHIEIGWNPNGHEPNNIYTLPHFDLHFYMITEAFQATIPFLAPVVNGAPVFDLFPAPGYLPVAYQMGPGLVPNMGAHSVDVLAPEFNGGVFSKTFIYGSYQGHITFLEPMFTLDYLTSLNNQTSFNPIPIRPPQYVERAGYYPTSYTISYDDSPEQYRISLNNLVYRLAR
ncbi:hypothetical protein [Hymenobacter armeniacus]|uniref:DUF5602 domain-containing protein n=1 Tax=Hymenobacter armeniacus TaxID=2771358 RepID=A0ABR8JUS7_9BACT|nr:hypothetical protein [Hymenobacter armeniacus]MBD2721494.1 hypothetical protein [Hymenobacter armeniacus]